MTCPSNRRGDTVLLAATARRIEPNESLARPIACLCVRACARAAVSYSPALRRARGSHRRIQRGILTFNQLSRLFGYVDTPYKSTTTRHAQVLCECVCVTQLHRRCMRRSVRNSKTRKYTHTPDTQIHTKQHTNSETARHANTHKQPPNIHTMHLRHCWNK